VDKEWEKRFGSTLLAPWTALYESTKADGKNHEVRESCKVSSALATMAPPLRRVCSVP
jgi:hypothetical protein